jgi:hypothetical protein
MGTWRTLFEIGLRHGYFFPARCEGLGWSPTPESAAWLARSGGLLKATPEGIAFVHDDPARAAALAGRWFAFEVTVGSSDPWFGAYTEGPPAGQMACVALEADRPAATPAPASAWPPGRPQSAALLVRVGLGPWLAQRSQQWQIELSPRATHWKYWLPAEWAPQQPQVVDAAGQVDFEPVAVAAFDNGRAALVTHSRQPIALAARPRQRFALHARAPLADPVLVKRLPVASAGQFGVETIAGVRSLVSEIYVNR